MDQNTAKFTSDQDKFIHGFKTNDRHCLEKVYSMYYGAVQKYVVKNNGDENEAKDVFQEALIATWLNLKENKFSPKTSDSLGAYIFQIAKFKWLDKLKSKPHKMTTRIEYEHNIENEHEDVNENDIQKQKLDKLKNLYAKLDYKCKQILDKYYYQKMSLEEIGQELSHDSGTIKTMKYRCMKKLRSVYLSQMKNKQ